MGAHETSDRVDRALLRGELPLVALLPALPLVDPLRRSSGRFPATLKLFRWLVPLLCVGPHLAATLSPLGLPVDHGTAVRAILAITFVVLGNSMGKLRHDGFVGIRTPRTLAAMVLVPVAGSCLAYRRLSSGGS